MSKYFNTPICKSEAFENVDSEAGIITGVSVATIGEAKGHGVFLDSEFIEYLRKRLIVAKEVLSNDGTIYFSAPSDKKFYAINPDGTLKASLKQPQPLGCEGI